MKSPLSKGKIHKHLMNRYSALSQVSSDMRTTHKIKEMLINTEKLLGAYDYAILKKFLKIEGSIELLENELILEFEHNDRSKS